MRKPSDVNDSDWLSAVGEAAAHLAGEGSGSLVFHERRLDLRLGVDGEGRGETTASWISGASVRRGLEAHRTTSLSDPSPQDIVDLAAGRPGDPGRLDVPVELPADPASETILERLRSLVEDIAATIGPNGRVRADSVQAVQQVVLARPDSEPVRTVRVGRRVRVEVRLERGGRGSVAAIEAALSPSPDAKEWAGCLRHFATIAQRALERLEARSAPSGPTTAVFAAGVGGVLIHEVVGHGLEGDVVSAAGSALAAAPGRVAPAGVSVLDDPRRGRMAWRVDDEGSQARATGLVVDGRVSGALHDLASARRASVAATGHGRRSSYKEPVRPRMGCTFLSPGEHRPEEVIAETQKGILVRRMEGAWTEPRSGSVTFRVTDADAIESGRLGPPLAPFLIYVNSLAALRGLDRVANDLSFDVCIGTCVKEGQPVATSVGAPTFRIGVVSVPARE